ncbi:Integrator complex subunit 7 [Aphelenchoides fujianensis]|nr:Integrator complex subunit 7 [Aphelenchoides fujianensis]
MAHPAMHQLERSLLTQQLPEILPAIANCAKAVRENPFPLFVNGLLLRLAEIFQGDKLGKMDQSFNLLRLRIIKLLQECRTDLSAAFSSEEVVRRVMKVSHSNDYKSRSLTMLFLAAVAPVVFENKKVHYLLVEGLDCDEMTELTAAIVASGSLGRLSYEFSSLVVEKIGELVGRVETDPNIKVRLMDDLSFFQENVAVTQQCMELGRNLLRNNPSQRITVAVIGALTELAKRNGLALSEQIGLLLDGLEDLADNNTLLTCYVANLHELAEAPQHWTKEQVIKLFHFKEKIVASRCEQALNLWLGCLARIAKHVHGQTIGDRVMEILFFANDPNVTIRINFIDVIFGLLHHSQPDSLLNPLGLCTTSILRNLTDRECAVSLSDRVKFYKMFADFIRSDLTNTFAFEALEAAVTLQQVDDSHPPLVFAKTLELLSAICDRRAEVAEEVGGWALGLLCDHYGHGRKPFEDAPMGLFSLALLPNDRHHARLDELMGAVLAELKARRNFWFAYKLARQGFRYGHWNDISLLLLEEISGKPTTVEASSFISALHEIASAELPAKIDVSTLNRTRKRLHEASLLLTPLARNSRNSHNFLFASEYVDYLCDLVGLLHSVVVFLNANMRSDPFDYGIGYMEYAKLALDKTADGFKQVQHKWAGLLQRSFDADEETQEHLSLMAVYCSLLQSILARLTSADPLDFPPPATRVSSAMNRKFEQLIDWGVAQSNGDLRAVSGAEDERVGAWKANLATLECLFDGLGSIPLALPRFFFQQVWRTTIRLNVTPQPKEHEPSLVLTAKQVAVAVEGIISSNNPKKIANVIVQLKLRTLKTAEPRTVEYRECAVRDNYFKAQFLLEIRKNVELSIGVLFTDAQTKRTWETTATHMMNVKAAVQEVEK